jgi:hypothetical protein
LGYYHSVPQEQLVTGADRSGATFS